MLIINDFLSSEIFDAIQKNFLSVDFPWYWCDYKVKNYSSLKEIDNCQFVHTFYENNERLSRWDISPIIQQLNVNALVRIKANLTVGTHSIMKYGFHTDNDLNCKTAIYYLNTNNGFTEFIDGTKVESVENRMVIFDSNIKHTGTTCTDSKRRVVLNINYF